LAKRAHRQNTALARNPWQYRFWQERSLAKITFGKNGLAKLGGNHQPDIRGYQLDIRGYQPDIKSLKGQIFSVANAGGKPMKFFRNTVPWCSNPVSKVSFSGFNIYLYAFNCVFKFASVNCNFFY